MRGGSGGRAKRTRRCRGWGAARGLAGRAARRARESSEGMGIEKEVPSATGLVEGVSSTGKVIGWRRYGERGGKSLMAQVAEWESGVPRASVRGVAVWTSLAKRSLRLIRVRPSDVTAPVMRTSVSPMVISALA